MVGAQAFYIFQVPTCASQHALPTQTITIFSVRRRLLPILRIFPSPSDVAIQQEYFLPTKQTTIPYFSLNLKLVTTIINRQATSGV